jgi:hypothetical protein
MIGLVLALVVVALVVSLLGGWIFGLAIAAAAIIVCVVFIGGFGRRTAAREP